jgi:hypothetical protein
MYARQSLLPLFNPALQVIDFGNKKCVIPMTCLKRKPIFGKSAQCRTALPEVVVLVYPAERKKFLL